MKDLCDKASVLSVVMKEVFFIYHWFFTCMVEAAICDIQLAHQQISFLMYIISKKKIIILPDSPTTSI
jgi:hypothetical protein